jgi:isopenicillin-N epimerase
MCSIPVQTTDPIQLQFKLFEKYKIQTPIFVQDEQTYLRFSINGYNSQGDIDKLKNAVVEIKQTTALIDAKG